MKLNREVKFYPFEKENFEKGGQRQALRKLIGEYSGIKLPTIHDEETFLRAMLASLQNGFWPQIQNSNVREVRYHLIFWYLYFCLNDDAMQLRSISELMQARVFDEVINAERPDMNALRNAVLETCYNNDLKGQPSMLFQKAKKNFFASLLFHSKAESLPKHLLRIQTMSKPLDKLNSLFLYAGEETVECREEFIFQCIICMAEMTPRQGHQSFNQLVNICCNPEGQMRHYERLSKWRECAIAMFIGLLTGMLIGIILGSLVMLAAVLTAMAPHSLGLTIAILIVMVLPCLIGLITGCVWQFKENYKHFQACHAERLTVMQQLQTIGKEFAGEGVVLDFSTLNREIVSVQRSLPRTDMQLPSVEKPAPSSSLAAAPSFEVQPLLSMQ
jgi:hypothetical protein